MADAGGDVAALCRAARRMRGPIERDVVSAECLLEGSAGEAPTSSLERAARALGLEVSAALALGYLTLMEGAFRQDVKHIGRWIT